MGKSNSKHRTSVTTQKPTDPAPQSSWQAMDGPSFYCAYLGFTPVSKPPTNMGVLQTPVRELYYKYRKSSQATRSANLRLTQKGILVVLYEDGRVKAELLFEFSSVIFVEAVKFSPVKTSSERKPKAIFVPVDESKTVPEKNAFLVDKAFHFLVSTTHPPLVVCVVRRPQGVKALDCHVFALDSVENALHITALISSTQTSANEPPLRSRGSFERTPIGGSDVIRTEYGEYNVYRGPQQGYENRSSLVYDDRGAQIETDRGVSMFPGGGGRNSYIGGGGDNGGPRYNQGPPPGAVSGILLTQEDFHRSHQPQQQQYQQQQFQLQQQQYQPMSPRSPGEGPYIPPPVPGSAPQFRLPDLLDRGPSESTDHGVMYEEVNMRNREYRSTSNTNSGNISGRMSGGYQTGGAGVSSRPTDLNSPRYPSGGQPSQRFSGGSESSHTSGGLVSPRGSGVVSPRTSNVFSPTSSSVAADAGDPFIFSASNLEGRRDPEEDDSDRFSGKPVAKVPPHMKAGIKVLPSDFRAVKLKPKAEKKPSDSGDESGGYDNNKEVMTKYRELQERSEPGRGGTYPDGEDFRNFSAPGRQGSGQYDSEIFSPQLNDDSRRRPQQRYEETDRWQVGGLQGGPPRSGVTQENDPKSVKDAEIADMFSNIRLQAGGRLGNPVSSNNNRSDFEQGLGYLP